MIEPNFFRDSSADSGPLLVAEAVTKSFSRRTRRALAPTSLDVRRGEIIAVVGHNGAGKSTLFDVLGGVTSPTGGTVTRAIGAADIGWCPQREIIDWSLTVRQNIALGLDLRARLPRSERARQLADVAVVLGLSDYLDRTAETLSGGELRRTQIARALVGAPALLLLDEPTTGLDPVGIRLVFEYLRDCRHRGGAALISTHETSRFAPYCTRVMALHDGVVVADEPASIFSARSPEGTDLWAAYTTLVGEGTAS